MVCAGICGVCLHASHTSSLVSTGTENQIRQEFIELSGEEGTTIGQGGFSELAAAGYIPFEEDGESASSNVLTNMSVIHSSSDIFELDDEGPSSRTKTADPVAPTLNPTTSGTFDPFTKQQATQPRDMGARSGGPLEGNLIDVMGEDDGTAGEGHEQPLVGGVTGLDIFQSPTPAPAKQTPFDDMGMFGPAPTPPKPAAPAKPSANPGTFDPFQPLGHASSKPSKPPAPSPAVSAAKFDPFDAFEPTPTPVSKPPVVTPDPVSFDLLDPFVPVTPAPKQNMSRPSSGPGLLMSLPSAFQSSEPELDQIFASTDPFKTSVPPAGPAPTNPTPVWSNQAASSSAGGQWGTFDPFGSLPPGSRDGAGVLRAEPLRPSSSATTLLPPTSTRPGPPKQGLSATAAPMSKAHSASSMTGGVVNVGVANGAAAQPFKPNYNSSVMAGGGGVAPPVAMGGRSLVGQPMGPSPQESPRVSPIHFSAPLSSGARLDPFADLGAVKVSKPSTSAATSSAPPPGTKANVPPMTFRPTYQVYGGAMGAQTQAAAQQRSQPAKTESKPVFASVIGEREEKGSRVMTSKGWERGGGGGGGGGLTGREQVRLVTGLI